MQEACVKQQWTGKQNHKRAKATAGKTSSQAKAAPPSASFNQDSQSLDDKEQGWKSITTRRRPGNHQIMHEPADEKSRKQCANRAETLDEWLKQKLMRQIAKREVPSPSPEFRQTL